MHSTILQGRHVLRTLLLPLGFLLACDPGALLPALLSTSVDGGGLFSRSEWIVMRFAEDVPPGAHHRAHVFCNDEQITSVKHRLDERTLVLQPKPQLPWSSTCVLRVNTEEGIQRIQFFTRAPRASFLTLHDRRDVDLPLPFPDDHFLSPASSPTGWRPLFTGRLPRPGGASQTMLDRASATVAARSDGWSPIGQITVQLNRAPDPSTLPLDRAASLDPLSSVALLDLSPGSPNYGERVPFQLIPRTDTLPGEPAIHVLVIHPGIALEPGGTYGLVVTDRVHEPFGEPLFPSSFFRAVLAEPSPFEASEITLTRSRVEPVLALAESLAPVPIPRHDVVLAARLTIRTTHDFPDDVLIMRSQVRATPPNVQITSVTPSGDQNVAAIVRGTFDAPVWIQNLGILNRSGGRPATVGTTSIPFLMALPTSANTEGLAPLVMHQHGSPGTADFGTPNAAYEFLGEAGFAVAGFTDPWNRDYPTAFDQFELFFSVFLIAGVLPEFQLTTYAEQMAFLRAIRSLDTLDVLPLGAPDGIPDLDTSVISYEGISYGSTHAQAFLAYEPGIASAGMVAGATRLAELFEHQDRTTPIGNPEVLSTWADNVSNTRAPDFWMAMSLLAAIYDPQDPHNHARFLYRDPLFIDGTTQRASILIVEGLDDSFTSNNSTRSLARQLGLAPGQAIPQLAPAVEPVPDLPALAGPIQGNVDAFTTAAMIQLAPDGHPLGPSSGCEFSFEGHFCAQVSPVSYGFRQRLYESALVGVPVID